MLRVYLAGRGMPGGYADVHSPDAVNGHGMVQGQALGVGNSGMGKGKCHI